MYRDELEAAHARLHDLSDELARKERELARLRERSGTRSWWQRLLFWRTPKRDLPSGRTRALILGAGRGGAHVLKALLDRGVPVAGIYDKDPAAPGLALAEREQVPRFKGSMDQLAEMLSLAALVPDAEFAVFLPSRHAGFVDFALRELDQARARGMRNLRVLRLGVDFSDDEAPARLAALCGPDRDGAP